MSDSIYASSHLKDTVERSTQKQGTRRKTDANEQLRQQFEAMIDQVNLSPLQKNFLKFRWLDQVLWMEKRAKKARDSYYRFRLVSIIGGIILPGLVTLSVNKAKEANISTWLYWGTFALSQVVVISTATEQLFGYGERWIHYRRSAESLKTQGWQFFQLSGPYASHKGASDYQEAFNLFVSQVEDVIQRDVEIYATQAIQKKTEQNFVESKSDLAPKDAAEQPGEIK